jgi:predicted DCC family thiol-disulfide oxidoreductase YuxK
MCLATVARVRRQDRRGRLVLVDSMAPGFDVDREGMRGRALDEAMHVRFADGTIAAGADAVLAIADAIPSLWLLRLAGRVPGFRLVARPLYAWVARNRYRVTGRCTDDRCRI